MAFGIKAFFKSQPLASNCITYGLLYMGAELSQQTLLRKILPKKQQNLDLATVGRYGVLGSTVFPTLMFYWYKLLDGRIVGTTPKIIVTKVLIDFVATMPLIIGPLHLF